MKSEVAEQARVCVVKVCFSVPVLLGQYRNLVPPREPSLGPAVDQHHGWCFFRPSNHIMHVDAVDGSTMVLH